MKYPLSIKMKMKMKKAENNASTPTAAKAQPAKPTQAAVCVDATVSGHCKRRLGTENSIQNLHNIWRQRK